MAEAAVAGTALHGRAEETRTLGEVLDRLAAGQQAILLVEGEAGIGKSRLLADTLDDARRRGFQVFAGRGEELERTRPFGVLAEALGCTRTASDPQRAAIAELLVARGEADHGPITVTSDPGLQFRAVDAFVDLAEALALDTPLLVGLDDLQWADPSSLLTIGALARRLHYAPVALIGCLRPSPRTPQLQRLLDTLPGLGARQLSVRRLTEEAVADLVADVVGAEPGPRLMREIAGASGNPLFVTELLAAIGQEGVLRTSGGRADVTEMTLPPTLRLTILRRLSFLSEETLQALRSASILGSTFSLTDLSVSTARPALSLSMSLAEAIAGRVLADDGSRLRFRHDLIRDAIYEDLPGSVRFALHREAGQRLAAAGAPARQVAEHLARGSTTGDSETISWMISAARAEAQRSPGIAADLLGRAVGLMEPTDPARDRLLAEQAGSLMWAGRAADAQAACHSLLARVRDPVAEGSVLISLGLALLAGGRPLDGLRELERAEAIPQLDAAERARGLGWACICRMWLGDLDGSLAVADQAHIAAAASEDHMTATVATTMYAVVSGLRGRLSAALEYVDEAVRYAHRSPERMGLRYPVHAPRAFILVELDRLDEARSTLDTGTRSSEELGTRWHLPSYQMARAIERFTAGEWDDAIAEVEASVELADETGELFSLIISRSVLALICLHRNDLARAAEVAEAAVDQLTRTGARYRSQWAVCARALVQEASGDVEGAYTTLSDCWDHCTRMELSIEYRVIGADLVRLCLATGHDAQARDVTAGVEELAAANDIPSLTGAALRCRGLVEDDPEILSAAVAAYADGPRVAELALAAEDAGAAFVRRGRLDQARPLLERALEIYERLDAARDLARAEALLRAAGVRRGRRGRRARPQFGWSSLTPTEESIARLVAEGLSNPQIGERLYVSRRTVQTHLAHVFAKLDVSSRTQLASEVTKQYGTEAAPSR